MPRFMQYSHLMYRFMRKIDTSAGSCWTWTGATRAGYGAFKVDGDVVPAHRFAYESFVGRIPDGMVLQHQCDNPACVNPMHLQPGTQRENMIDCFRKGRSGGYVRKWLET